MKGNLIIKNSTRFVELDAEFIGINNYNGDRKATSEVVGKINTKDFGLTYDTFNHTSGLALGQDIKLIANLEFRV